MTGYPFRGDIREKPVAIIYKKSRFLFTQEKGVKQELDNLKNNNDALVHDLLLAHKNNLACIEKVKSVVEQLGFKYRLMCRSDLKPNDLHDQFVVSVGGDGTLLDASHYCFDSPIMGVNSDPQQSVGALCIATAANITQILQDIIDKKLMPTPVARLAITKRGHTKNIMALNDVLYCHQNPAATSRYFISCKGRVESHRSSGIWIATAAGSTGGIYSSGGSALPIEANEAIFHVREPYWADHQRPQLYSGFFGPGEQLEIRSNMSDAHLYVDGPHKSLAVPLGESVSIALSDKPLWLFNGSRMNDAREKAIEQRKLYRRLLNDDDIHC